MKMINRTVVIHGNQSVYPESPGVVIDGEYSMCAATAFIHTRICVEQGNQSGNKFISELIENNSKDIVAKKFVNQGFTVDQCFSIMVENDRVEPSERSQTIEAILRDNLV